MSDLHKDPDFRGGLLTLDDKLTMDQIRFVGSRLRDLIQRYEIASRDERLRPIEWLEWSAFIDATYACGFVCGDAGEDMGDREQTPVYKFIRKLEVDVGLVETLCLRDLRRILHYIMRSERWGDGGAGTGGGAVWGLITSRLGNAIACRLGA
ncbi:MAG: hypothetical protein NXI02_31665 [Rhodobacteraceae bacterium]|nr:hypothetical protein [Paracoccaceae bacterium]